MPTHTHHGFSHSSFSCEVRLSEVGSAALLRDALSHCLLWNYQLSQN